MISVQTQHFIECVHRINHVRHVESRVAKLITYNVSIPFFDMHVVVLLSRLAPRHLDTGFVTPPLQCMVDKLASRIRMHHRERKGESITNRFHALGGYLLSLVPLRAQDCPVGGRVCIPEDKRGIVKAGAMDMWQPFMDALGAVFGPDTPIVHDKFHVSKYLGGAVDTVRKGEHKILTKAGCDTLVKTKYLWLKNPDTWEADEKKRFKELMHDQLKVGRAWALKETFRKFWEYTKEWSALRFFKRWYFRATHSHLKPIIEVAKMLKRHLDGLLAYTEHPISNAVTEGLNSKIQTIKANARGFRNFAHYRIGPITGYITGC